jgi:hypothetical protein
MRRLSLGYIFRKEAGRVADCEHLRKNSHPRGATSSAPASPPAQPLDAVLKPLPRFDAAFTRRVAENQTRWRFLSFAEFARIWFGITRTCRLNYNGICIGNLSECDRRQSNQESDMSTGTSFVTADELLRYPRGKARHELIKGRNPDHVTGGEWRTVYDRRKCGIKSHPRSKTRDDAAAATSS